jgi:hypothetical protein
LEDSWRIGATLGTVVGGQFFRKMWWTKMWWTRAKLYGVVNLTPWAPAIALGGVVIGYVGQTLTRRLTSKLSYAERKITLRNDRRDVIFAFLDEIQKTEQMIDVDDNDIRHDVPQAERRITEDKRLTRLHRMWFEQKRVQVVGDDALKWASRSYTITMRDLIFREGIAKGDSIWEYMDDDKEAFLKIAQIELYSSDLFNDKVHWWQPIAKYRASQDGKSKAVLLAKLRYGKDYEEPSQE